MATAAATNRVLRESAHQPALSVDEDLYEAVRAGTGGDVFDQDAAVRWIASREEETTAGK